MDMKIRNGIIGFFIGMAVWAVVLYPQGLYGEEKVYTVRRGETLYSIARSLGIKVDDLMKHNGIGDPGRLLEGQRLKIPEQTQEGGLEVYRVVRGDTFYSLARKFSVTEADIRKANDLKETYMLREGDSLMIPQKIVPGAVAQSPEMTSAPVANAARTPVSGTSGGASASVLWPVTARELSYISGKLSGVAIIGDRAEPVKSLTSGTVISAGPYRGFGRVAIIQVEGGYHYVYGGCESLSVKEGDKVSPGTEIGRLGIDAKLNKPQLFFMVFRGNTPVDPVKAPRA